MIGNLMPLSTEINNNMGNNDFADKIKFLKKSSFKIVSEFIEENKNQKDWTQEDIIKRTKDLSKLAYENVWKISND